MLKEMLIALGLMGQPIIETPRDWDDIELAGKCPVTKIEGDKEYGWTAFDKQTLARAKKRCAELYPRSPCVKIFRKIAKQDYQVICGK